MNSADEEIPQSMDVGQPLPILSLSQLHDLDIPECPKLLPWLPQGGLCMIAGAPGTGKTFFSMALSLALAKGSAFLKWYNPEPQEVLYIDGEMSLLEMRQRFVDFDREYDLINNFGYLPAQIVYEKEQRDLNIDSKEFQSRIQAEVMRRPGLRLVVIDNLSCLTPNTPENKRDDWVANILPFLIWFRRRNIAVIIMHHTGKDGLQRGTSSRADALDTVLTLEAVKQDDDESHGAHFILRFKKHRSCTGDDIKPLEITAVGGQFDFKPYTEGLRERFLKMASEGIDNVSDMAEALDCTKGAVSKIKAKLQQSGVLLKGGKIRPR